MALPVITTADDVVAVVDYLKNKPTGATLSEAQAVVKKQVLDGRKLNAYQAWGIVSRDGDRLKLTPRGWALSRSKPGDQADVFREIADSLVPYRSVLEWIHHQGMATVTNVDVAAQWHEHHAEALGTDNANTIKDNAVCFFHICEAAGLGKMTMGRKGNPTRLSVDRDALRKHIEEGPSAPPWVGNGSAVVPNASEEIQEEGVSVETPVGSVPPPEIEQSAAVVQAMRVFISHGGNMQIVEQVETMLGLADMRGEVAEKEETPAIPVPEKVLSAMRRCQAGIIVVSVEESKKDHEGNYRLNENVLIEIGSAFVLYDKKVVLVWDKRLSIPSNLQGLYRCEYEGDELSWTAGMKLIKAIQGFKQRVETVKSEIV